MTASRRRNLLHQRRRRPDEGEDDDGIGAEHGEDSQSEESALTEVEDHLADASDGSEGDALVVGGDSKVPQDAAHRRTRNGTRPNKTTKPARANTLSRAESTPSLRTEPMAADSLLPNGHGATDLDHQHPRFRTQSKSQDNSPERNTLASKPQTPGKRGGTKEPEPRRERAPHNPGRGGFFMHDQRGDAGAGGDRGGAGRGRGRGRGAVAHHPVVEYGVPGMAPPHGPTLPEANGGRWDHDLHDTVAHGAHGRTPGQAAPHAQQDAGAGAATRAGGASSLLSKSVSIGTVTARVLLPFMKTPINFERMPVKQHTRLPDLRPPLRRDKPVRVSLPDQAPRYIFPSTERSFIFIPRAQRPNQQGSRFRRGGGHFSQAGSRRPSVYGGSTYTPSVAMSRRSSFARDGLVSPTGSVRPVVKLPLNGAPFPVPNGYMAALPPMGHTPYGMLPHAMYRGPPQGLPMHQPRPQKAVSVATIDSPQADAYAAPQQQEQQPFHHQVPAHMNGAAAAAAAGSSSHGRQVSVHSQTSAHTPLSLIPEQAINAQPFQPMYAAPFAPGHAAYPGMFMYTMDPMQSGHAASYMMPMMQGPAVGAAPGAMYEQGGTTFYYDPNMQTPMDYGGGNGGGSGGSGGGGGGMGGEGYYYGAAPMMYYPSA